MVGCYASRQVTVSFALHSANINKVPEGRKINHPINTLYSDRKERNDTDETARTDDRKKSR